MKQFEIPARLNLILFAMIGIGLLSIGLTLFYDGGHHERLWSNLLHNSVYFTVIAFMALFFYCANITALSGWYTQFKRIWEAYSLFLLPGLILMAVVGLSGMMGWSHLYHWADANTLDPASEAYDEILVGKSPFLNWKWYMMATLLFGGIWYFVARKLRSLSIAEDNHGSMEYKQHRTMRIWAAFLLIFGGFTSAAAIWLWMMSVDAHWYSTLYAWYTCGSALVAMLALTILTIIYLKSLGYYEKVSIEHIHDLGKYMFAFTIFWTYMWFSQYMLIWYANIGEETIYFKERLDNYPVLFFGNLIINFALPFLVLLRNDTKRKYGTMVFVSVVLVFGHWFDYFLMLKPGILHTTHAMSGDHGHGDAGHGDLLHGAVESAQHVVGGFAAPGFLELGTFIGFLGFFLLFSYHAMRRANLEPRRDPYYEESLHHHV